MILRATQNRKVTLYQEKVSAAEGHGERVDGAVDDSEESGEIKVECVLLVLVIE